jgi:hypothetical protein
MLLGTSSEIVLYAAPYGKKIGLFAVCRLLNRKIYVDNYCQLLSTLLIYV